TRSTQFGWVQTRLAALFASLTASSIEAVSMFTRAIAKAENDRTGRNSRRPVDSSVKRMQMSEVALMQFVLYQLFHCRVIRKHFSISTECGYCNPNVNSYYLPLLLRDSSRE